MSFCPLKPNKPRSPDFWRQLGRRFQRWRPELRKLAVDEGFRPGTIDEFINRIPRMLDPALRLNYQGYVDHGLEPLVSRLVSRGQGPSPQPPTSK